VTGVRADDPRWVTAIHEAGHAVVSHVLGRPVRSVTIVPEPGSFGHMTNFRHGPSWPDRLAKASVAGKNGGFIDGRFRRAFEIEIMILLGGGMAEASITRTNDPGLAWLQGETVQPGGAGVEVGNAVGLIGKVSGGDDEMMAYFAWLRHRTGSLLHSTKCWPLVPAVAAALCERETLRTADVRLVIEQEQQRVAQAFAHASGTPDLGDNEDRSLDQP